jgi:hypothetical protein
LDVLSRGLKVVYPFGRRVIGPEEIYAGDVRQYTMPIKSGYLIALKPLARNFWKMS